jgi:hypothetical protein
MNVMDQHSEQPGVTKESGRPTGSPRAASPRPSCRVFSMKVPVSLIAEVDRTLVRFVHTRREAPMSRNEFIRRSIEEKLDHLRRSSQRRPRRERSGRGTLRGGGNTTLVGMGFRISKQSLHPSVLRPRSVIHPNDLERG